MKFEAWFGHIYGRIYAAVVNEDIPSGLRSHVFIMRVTGIWPTANDTRRYNWLTIGIFIVFGLLSSLSLFVNLFFVNTIEEVTTHLFISLSCAICTFKAAIIYWQRDSIRELFGVHAALSSDVICNDRYNRIVRLNYRVHGLFACLYCCSVSLFIVQSIYSDTADSLIPANTHWSYGFLQHRAVFWIVFVYQVLCIFFNAICHSMEDSFYIALIQILCCHLTELKERLKALGTESMRIESRNSLFYKNLIECCERYENCLR